MTARPRPERSDHRELARDRKRGIALKLAECGVRQIGVHYLKQKDDAQQTARLVEQRGARTVLIQADVTRSRGYSPLVRRSAEGDRPISGVFVANARPDVQHFYRPALDLTLEQWRSAMDSQATALLLAVREAAGMMTRKGGASSR